MGRFLELRKEGMHMEVWLIDVREGVGLGVENISGSFWYDMCAVTLRVW